MPIRRYSELLKKPTARSYFVDRLMHGAKKSAARSARPLE
jgi:hypothetical protein